MTRTFDHEKLHVYQAALHFCVFVHSNVSSLTSEHRHAKDQLLRAALSIPLNIAEGNGKRISPDRFRFFEIARGSAMECAAIMDVLRVTAGFNASDASDGKEILYRVVCMLTKLIQTQSGMVREGDPLYLLLEGSSGEFEHHNEDEYEYENEYENEYNNGNGGGATHTSHETH